MKVLVKSKKLVANGIAAFKLVAPGGERLPLFSAGAHIDVFLGNDLVRQYSLCNAPSDRSHYQIGVLLEPNSRGGSRAMHDLAEGQLIEISEPKKSLSADRRGASLCPDGRRHRNYAYPRDG